MIRCDAPGTDPGAPIKSQTGRKLIWTTIISAVIFALAMMAYGYEYRAAVEAEGNSAVKRKIHSSLQGVAHLKL
jgi:hypothetical protein